MRARNRAATGLLSAVVALTPVAVSPAVASAAPGAPPVRSGPGAPTFGPAPAVPATVTLITGDTVVVAGADVKTVRPGPGREKITFTTRRGPDGLRVVPSDAQPLLNAGRVDPRLFDITTLLAFGYDDRRADLPLIVTGEARPATAGVTAVRAVPGGAAMRVAKSGATAAWRSLSAGPAGSRIWLDGLRRPALTRSVPQIGAPAAWSAGLDGAGVRVAVVDTGVDAAHPDLAGRVVAAQDFTTDGHTRDLDGHGTHVASTIVGTGAAPGNHRGVAPGASVVSAKVCIETGCAESWILAGMRWAVDQGAKVVNMSLGGLDTAREDPLEVAVGQLTAETGALFVISAGNSGRDGGIESPGTAPAALTVGAVNSADALAPFSSRGPRGGDAAVKPDITAPGVDISAARSGDMTTGTPGALHRTSSGTSMAAPHVAGAAAILRQQHPTWTPAQLKAALMGSAKPTANLGVYAQGAGRVDVGRAIGQSVLADPPSVSFGRQFAPHHDDVPDVRTITYRNEGAAAVTLALSHDGPAALFRLSASTVTVPAGGSASVTLTSDTRAAVPNGRHGGRVLARAGTLSVVTPFAVDKELDSFDLTITVLDRAGRGTENRTLTLADRATGRTLEVWEPGTTFTTRVREGTYTMFTSIFSGADQSLVVDPTLVVDRPLTLTIDARKARQVSARVPQPDAVTFYTEVGVAYPAGSGLDLHRVYSTDGTPVFVGQTDPAERLPGLLTHVHVQAAKGPLPVDEARPSPYAYHLSWLVRDTVPAGFQRTVTAADVATVHAEFGYQGVPTGRTLAYPVRDNGLPSASGELPVRLPGTRTDHYLVEPGLTWTRELIDGGMDFESWQTSARTAYEAGRSYTERLNAAVFGPALSEPGIGDPALWISGAGRWGDRMLWSVPPHSAAGRWTGFGATTRERTVITRDGVVLADEPFLQLVGGGLPPEEAEFTVRIEADQRQPVTLSSHVTAEWTFRSAAPPPGSGFVPLPLLVMRFTPPVDARNTAPAGTSVTVPISVQRPAGLPGAIAVPATVGVSYDDGATWISVPVRRRPAGGLAIVLDHPAAAGHVSLRASVIDSAGNSGRLTIIRAYRIA